jgi:hypothetical protein
LILLIFLGLFVAFWLWHSPVRRRLTQAEIDRYLEAVEKLPSPTGDSTKFLTRLRAWAEADDGKPVYMLNLMRYYQQLHAFPGSPDFHGTPQAANAYYEKAVLPILLKRGCYPIVGGKAQGKNLLDVPDAGDDWSRIVVVRYRNRRAFLSLLADPAYAPFVPYKLMALETALVPVSRELTIPDLRWVVGGILVILFLAVGWIRASAG